MSIEPSSRRDGSLRSVAVLSRSFSSHPVLRKELLSSYPNAVFNDSGMTLSGEALIDFLRHHDSAIVALERVDAKLLSALPDLKTISKYGVGLDNIDLKSAARVGVQVGWIAGVNRRSVAELTIAFMIAALRGVIVSHEEIRSGIWRQYRGRQLSDAAVGLIGFGHVGKEVAQLLSCFGSKVLAFDIRDVAAEAKSLNVEICTLDVLLRSADVVSLHLPFTAKTSSFLNADRIATMKHTAVLVNTARGGLVDEDAVYKALSNGDLSGACFDVFTLEPPLSNKLINVKGFLGTSHIGGSAEEAVIAMGRAAIAGLSQCSDPLSLIPEWERE